MLFSPYVISPAEFEIMWPYGLAGLIFALVLIIATSNLEKEESK